MEELDRLNVFEHPDNLSVCATRTSSNGVIYHLFSATLALVAVFLTDVLWILLDLLIFIGCGSQWRWPRATFPNLGGAGGPDMFVVLVHGGHQVLALACGACHVSVALKF